MPSLLAEVSAMQSKNHSQDFLNILEQKLFTKYSGRDGLIHMHQ